MVGVEHIAEHNVFAPFCHAEIQSGEYTYDIAVKKIIELNEIHDFDWIYVDAGHGEMQIEQLKLHGLANPKSGLDKKVVRINFSEKVTVRDPVTKIREKKDIKPFMVNNTVLLFERGQFAFNPKHKEVVKQFEDYHIERFGTNGRPVYTDVNEHMHDCIILAIHGFNMKYNDMFKVKHATKIGKIDAFSKSKVPVGERKEIDEVATSKPEPPSPSNPISTLRYIGMRPGRRSPRSGGAPTRKSF